MLQINRSRDSSVSTVTSLWAVHVLQINRSRDSSVNIVTSLWAVHVLSVSLIAGGTKDFSFPGIVKPALNPVDTGDSFPRSKATGDHK